MAAKKELASVDHFEVWYADPDSARDRYQTATDQDHAVAIAKELASENKQEIKIHKISTTRTVLDIDIPVPEPEVPDN